MFKRFTPRVRRVMILAREEAERYHHEYLGTEHMLLGMLQDGGGSAITVLEKAGFTIEQIRMEVVRDLPRHTHALIVEEILFTSQAKKVLEHSVEEARLMGHNYIGTVHLLLGLLKEKEGLAAKVLHTLGVELVATREKIIEVFRGQVAHKTVVGHPGETETREKSRNISETLETQTMPMVSREHFPNTGKRTGLVRALIHKLFGSMPRSNASFQAKLAQYEALKRKYQQSLEQLAQEKAQNEKLVGARQEAKEQINTLKNERDKLGAPPNAYGIFRQRNKDGTIDVNLDGRRLRVNVHPQLEQYDFAPGQPVVLNESLNVIDLGEYENHGDNDNGTIGEYESFRKSRHKQYAPQEVKVKFADVAGADEAKEALEEIVAYLRNPTQFHRLGARLPKGVLLTGAPGTGKTLLARAVAGEANVPFVSVTGSDFVELFVGVGPARVRDMFNQTKKLAQEHGACLLFIDEIDAVGRQRSVGVSGANDEQNQTLNQLLSAMNGFEPNEGIIVIAATNRIEILDQALLRPGRFDRKIPVPLPNLRARKEILQIHSRGMPLAQDVDLHESAVQSATLTGADLATLVNEAALLAARQQHTTVYHVDFENALQRIGHRLPDAQSPDELYHAVVDRVVGQPLPTRAVAHAISMHYTDIRTAGDAIGTRQPSKPNVLLYGPSGSGKTWIVESFARQLQVPFASFDVTTLVYDPRSFSSALRRLVESAENNERRAGLGVMCLYGLDRLLTLNTPSVQEELARIIEGARFDVPVSDGYADRSTYSVHTAQLLFVAEATLMPDETSLSERLKESAVGPFAQGTREFHASYLSRAGLVPRLLDVFPIIEATSRLTSQDLRNILNLSHNGSSHGAPGHATDGQVVSLIEQYQRRFKDVKSDLHFEPEALDAIAEEAYSLGGNARVLAAILEQVMRTHLQDLAGPSVTVTWAMVEAARAGHRVDDQTQRKIELARRIQETGLADSYVDGDVGGQCAEKPYTHPHAGG